MRTVAPAVLDAVRNAVADVLQTHGAALPAPSALELARARRAARLAVRPVAADSQESISV
jgi:hypothetical protein